MKLHAVAILTSALFFVGCAESVEDIPAGDTPTDSGSSGGDSSTGKDSAPVDTGSVDPDTGSTDDDTGTVDDDTGSVEDTGEFPDFGSGTGDDAGGDETGAGDAGMSFGFGYCSSSADCPGGCCTEGTCGVNVFGSCVTF